MTSNRRENNRGGALPPNVLKKLTAQKKGEDNVQEEVNLSGMWFSKREGHEIRGWPVRMPERGLWIYRERRGIQEKVAKLRE